MPAIQQRYQQVKSRIYQACLERHRDPESVKLLAVSKQRSATEIRQIHSLGQRSFGESYLQEALKKMPDLAELSIEWHFIGPLQSNKSRKIAAHFDWVQSVDNEKLLRRLSAQRPDGLPPINILLQVNIDAEPQKRGVEESGVLALSRLALTLPRLRLRGLMAIPDPAKTPDQAEGSLRRMAGLMQKIQQLSPEIDTLSLGMSADMEAAIAAGSTMVRIGTDLFGPRI